MLLDVINDLIHREPGSYYGQYWEERLDLEDALMGSVCVDQPSVDRSITTCRTPMKGVYGGALPEDAAGFAVSPPIVVC